MRGLIDDLLAYSRAGSAPLALLPVDLGEIVRSVRESLRLAIAEADAVGRGGGVAGGRRRRDAALAGAAEPARERAEVPALPMCGP